MHRIKLEITVCHVFLRYFNGYVMHYVLAVTQIELCLYNKPCHCIPCSLAATVVLLTNSCHTPQKYHLPLQTSHPQLSLPLQNARAFILHHRDATCPTVQSYFHKATRTSYLQQLQACSGKLRLDLGEGIQVRPKQLSHQNLKQPCPNRVDLSSLSYVPKDFYRPRGVSFERSKRKEQISDTPSPNHYSPQKRSHPEQVM